MGDEPQYACDQGYALIQPDRFVCSSAATTPAVSRVASAWNVQSRKRCPTRTSTRRETFSATSFGIDATPDSKRWERRTESVRKTARGLAYHRRASASRARLRITCLTSSSNQAGTSLERSSNTNVSKVTVLLPDHPNGRVRRTELGPVVRQFVPGHRARRRVLLTVSWHRAPATRQSRNTCGSSAGSSLV
jgi:hypothetical protein